MKINEVISNVHIYGMDQAVIGSKYPMATDISKVNDEMTKTVVALATSKQGEGHDNFLNGVIVQFDLTFTNKAWVEAERYHFLDFISSQSTMHRMTKFNLDQAYIEYVDTRMIDIMKEKVAEYNALLEENKEDTRLKKMYLEILYSNPAGFKLTAKMTTNYRQLKTIYAQRRTHRLPEWQLFCDWLETLPHSEFITRKKEGV
ncbi:MAG: hypothetical protein R3Y57_00910 [Erysipelotrichaceae bacterium]